MRALVIILLLFIVTCTNAQALKPNRIHPDSSNFENVYVKKIAEDSLQSSFLIWVKEGVKSHYHARHTEIIKVVQGKGLMTIGDVTFKIKRGDYFVIPIGELHSVITTSRKPLKVISIQSPRYDGDRIWVD